MKCRENMSRYTCTLNLANVWNGLVICYICDDVFDVITFRLKRFIGFGVLPFPRDLCRPYNTKQCTTVLHCDMPYIKYQMWPIAPMHNKLTLNGGGLYDIVRYFWCVCVCMVVIFIISVVDNIEVVFLVYFSCVICCIHVGESVFPFTEFPPFCNFRWYSCYTVANN